MGFPCEKLQGCSTCGLRADLWKFLTPDNQSLSGDFSVEDLKSALQHLKPRKAAGPDPIGSELILHAGSEIQCWLCKFLFSCLRNLKIPKIRRRAFVVAILKPNQTPGDPKSYQLTLYCISPSRSLSILSTPVSSPPSTHFCIGSDLVSDNDKGDQPYIKSLCSLRTSRKHFGKKECRCCVC